MGKTPSKCYILWGDVMHSLVFFNMNTDATAKIWMEVYLLNIYLLLRTHRLVPFILKTSAFPLLGLELDLGLGLSNAL